MTYVIKLSSKTLEVPNTHTSYAQEGSRRDEYVMEKMKKIKKLQVRFLEMKMGMPECKVHRRDQVKLDPVRNLCFLLSQCF